MKHAMTARWSDDLRAALLSEATINGPYTMSLSGDSIEAVQKAVNQGIDGHLEACFLPSRGDSYEPNTTRFGQTLQYAVQRLDCVVSPESLVCLVRRLMESEDDEANNLASGICETLEIELI